MADELTMVNGGHQPNGKGSYSSREEESLKQSLDVAKNGYRESYPKIRTRRTSQARTSTINGREEISVSFSNEQHIKVLYETVSKTSSKFIANFDQVDEHYIETMTFDAFLEYIERQRLTHMPHRGSRWDKVLKEAEYFGLQVSEYAKAIDAFVPGSQTAAKLIWTASCTLLEPLVAQLIRDFGIVRISANIMKLGPDNAKALETAYGVFYELGLSLSMLLRQNKLLYANGHIRMEVAKAYNGILILVRDVSTHYYARVTGMLSSESAVDFINLFRSQIEGFASRKDHIVDSMWREQLGKYDDIDIATLRSWLNPRDRMLEKLNEDQTLTPEHRDEFTCEWFQRPLLDFSRSENDVLTLVGPEGCGKTYLSRWIVERLQRPLSKKTYESLFYTIETDIPGTTTSLAVVRGMSLQLLEKNVGDRSLFDALVEAYHLSVSNNATVGKLEDALWNALDAGLDQFAGHGKDHLMMIVDSLNNLKNQANIQSVVERLGNLTHKHSRLQAIVFSQQSLHKPKRGKFQPFELKPDHTREDIRHIAEHALRSCAHYRDRSEHQQEALVEQLCQKAKGDYLWLLLTIYLLRKETSAEAFEKAVKAVRDTPKSVEQTLKKILERAVDLSRSDAHLILSWMLVAQRPLAIAEIKSLLQIDLEKTLSSEWKINIKNEIHIALGPLVVFQNDFVRFRHPAIRNYLQSLQSSGNTKLLSLRDAQKDLTMRLLAYCKINLIHHHEPSMEPPGKSFVRDLLNQHVLLEYAVRNWTRHFRSSSLSSGDSLQPSADLNGIFPASTLMVMLEWACWSPQTTKYDSYELALRVRESVFAEKNECVLQSLIVCGSYFRTLAKTIEAGTCFYRASKIGQGILRKNHVLIVSCATTFLTITETVSSDARTEFVTRKEETLLYVIDVYKHQYGSSHDIVIKYYKVLAQLYIEIHEEQKAESIWRELKEIVVIRFGKGSEEETSISEQLVIVLKKGERKTNVVEYEKDLFDITEELEVWDIRRIEISLELVRSYEARREFFMAEEIYISLWRRLTEQCHETHNYHGSEIHIRMIDIVLEYARFLRRCHRHEEAANILICVWTEYEEYDFESETLFLRLKTIGELMRAVSLLSVAVSVFRKCRSWFKSRGKTEHSASCEVLISETVEEIVMKTTTIKAISTPTSTTSSSSTSISATTSSTTETVIREIFESTLSRKEVTLETISICKNLISFYMRLEQWSQALEVTKRSLSMIWKFVLSGAGTTALPHNFGAEAIDIAISLAICHYRSHHFHEAEDIYVRIYYACGNSCHIEDGRFVRSYETLVKFYEEHHSWRRMIEVYQDLLFRYRENLGAGHRLTIRTLYTLGSLCAEHGHGIALDYYVEIIEILNHGSSICHVDALDAMFIVCRMYYEGAYWHKLKHICQTLWETWRGKHHGHSKFTAELVEILYFRYRYVLEYHEVCEYSVLRQLIIEYRNTCMKIFGAAASITIKASIELAEICMRSETYIHEAVSIYEEVLTTIEMTTITTTNTSVVSTSTITKIKKSLTIAYVSICSHESVSVTTIERALKVMFERFDSLKVTHGYAHMETLMCLRELISLQLKLKKQESQSIVIRTLMMTCTEIIKTCTESRVLHESALFLADIYVSCGLNEQASSLIEELRVQIITGASLERSSFKIDKAIGKVSYVFLVTFEQIIRSHTVSYTEIMAEILTETYLYDAYKSSVKSQNDITTIMVKAARLRGFLTSHGRKAQIEIVQKGSYEIFIKKWESIVKRRDEISFTFYLSLLGELEKETRDASIGNAACAASVTVVRELLNAGNYQKALDVASCALNLVNNQRAFHYLRNVPYGFKLSALLVGRGLDRPLASDISSKLRESMSELSRKVIREVLGACKDSKVDFIRLRLRELNELSGLLGEQKNYGDLEWLLDLLWSSREVQKKWKPENIIAIGRRFVEARYFNKDRRSRAIRLCEDICYNLRRVWGSLDPKVLEMSDLLSELYTSMGHYREAQGVHESILRLVVEGDDGDDRTLDTISSGTARKHLDLLKQSFLRLQGWDKSVNTYKELVDALIQMYKGKPEWKGITGLEAWDHQKEKPSDTLGKFVAPKDWEFIRAEDLDKHGDAKDTKGVHRSNNAHRVASNWSLGDRSHLQQGNPEKSYATNGHMNGVGKQQMTSKAIPTDEDEDGYESATEEPKAAGITA